MRRHDLQAIAALTIAGGLVRFLTLDAQSFWLDEAVTVDVVRGSLADVVAHVAESESTPYLYYLLAWAWTQIFGLGEIGLRSLSALLGTLTIPVVYLAGARLVGRRAGVAAAAVVAVNPLAIHYSQEARAYGLLLLASAATLVGFATLYHDQAPSRRALALWSAASVVALASHYFAIFLIVGEAAVLAWTRPRLRGSLGLALLPVVTVGLLLLPLGLEQRSHGLADWISDESLVTRCVQVAKQFLVGLDGPAEEATAVVALLLVAAGGWLFVRRAPREQLMAVLAVACVGLIAVLAPLLAATVGTDYFNARNVIPALIPFVLVVGAAWASSRTGLALLSAYAILSLTLFAVVLVNPGYQRDDWRGAAAEIGPGAEPRVVVVSSRTAEIPLRLYLPSAGDLPRTGAEVREIVYVALGSKSPGSATTAPEPKTLAPPLTGFTLAGQSRGKTYAILRYRSPEPLRVGPEIAMVQRFGTDAGGGALLLQPADR